eukprot:SAG22_NODE_3410_length_1729_cov_2.131288_1_plen_60_part_00
MIRWRFWPPRGYPQSVQEFLSFPNISQLSILAANSDKTRFHQKKHFWVKVKFNDDDTFY